METADAERRIVVGRVLGAYGVRGWLKIKSFTEPFDNLLRYRPWWLEQDGVWRECRVISARPQSGSIVAQLHGVDVREAAMAMAGASIAVARDALPRLKRGEYYWTDLIGLRVSNRDGVYLGTVKQLLETGANDVLVLEDGETERLVPYVLDQYVLDIDLAGGQMLVDWDADF